MDIITINNDSLLSEALKAKGDECPEAIKDDVVQKMNNSDNTITLLNGTTLVCYPKTELTEGIEEEDARKEQDLRFFLDHAHDFRKNADKIFQDSRMFLAPVPECGFFSHPTLGIFLEWWIYGEEDFRKDKEGNDALTYYMIGNPMTGRNLCGCVYPDGTTKTIRHKSFMYVMDDYRSISNRYKALGRFDAYSLQEVWEILSSEQTPVSIMETKMMIQERRNAKLNQHLSALQKKYDKLSNKFNQICIKHYQKELDEFRNEYKRREQETENEIAKIWEQRRELKSQLNSGALDLMTYQKLVYPLAHKRRHLKASLIVFKAEQTRQLLSNNDITLSAISDYLGFSIFA